MPFAGETRPNSIRERIAARMCVPLVARCRKNNIPRHAPDAPDRDKPQWRWVSQGAITATILWIVASIGFTVYVANFNSYNKTYGSLGGAVILLTWLYLSAFMVLLGAVINAKSERQTRKDSTVGQPRAMGQRDALAADTLGESTGK